MKYECLDNLIGIVTDCEEIKGLSTYFVNQIPGIDLPAADGIANKREYKTGLEKIKSLLQFAYDQAGDDVLKGLDGSYAFNAILNQGNYCFYENEYKAIYPGFRGVRVKRLYVNNYTAMSIPSIRVCIKSAAALTITLKESTGKETTVVTGVIAAMTPTDVLLDYECVSEWVDITFDNTTVEVLQTACTSGCTGCNKGSAHSYDDFVTVYGLVDGITTTTETFGIIPFVQVVCAGEKLLCQIRKQIDLLCLYKFAGLFFMEMSLSKNNTRYTKFTREESLQQSGYYDNWIDDNGLYQKEMEKVKSSLRAFFGADKNVCFDCSDARYTYSTP